MAARGAGLRGCARARGGAAPSPGEPGGSPTPARRSARRAPPLAARRLQRPHGEYPRSRARSPRPSCPSASFVDFSFRLCACCFLFYQTTPQPHCHRCPPPSSLPLPGSPLKPQEPARESPGRPDRCFLCLSAALGGRFLL